MTRGTPEGARDFLVPVRLQPGKFFALAQSPQLFKQLCMVGGSTATTRSRPAGVTRISAPTGSSSSASSTSRWRSPSGRTCSTCWRQPSSRRSRRRPEAPPRPFPRIAYDEAMAKYGTDKPDLRFGIEIQDATEVTRGSEFGVFANAPCVRFLVVPKAFSRAEHGRLEDVAKEWGAKGLALPRRRGGEVRSPIAKFLSEAESRVRAGRARPCSSSPAPRRSSRACSGGCACTSAASSS